MGSAREAVAGLGSLPPDLPCLFRGCPLQAGCGEEDRCAMMVYDPETSSVLWASGAQLQAGFQHFPHLQPAREHGITTMFMPVGSPQVTA